MKKVLDKFKNKNGTYSPWLYRFLDFFPWIILIAAIFFTHYFWEAEKAHNNLEMEAKFNVLAHEKVDGFIKEATPLLYLLHDTQSLFQINHSPWNKSFTSYASALNLPEFYPAVHAMGFILKPESDNAAEKKSQTSTFQSGVYSPTENIDKEAYLNAYKNTYQREAMHRSRDTGEAIISHKTDLPNNIGNAYFMYLPIFQNGQTPDTISVRQKLLKGWVYLIVRPDVLSTYLAPNAKKGKEIIFTIYDEKKSNVEKNISNLIILNEDEIGDLITITPFNIYGSEWTAISQSTNYFDRQFELSFTNCAPFFGIFIAVLLIIVRGLINLRSRSMRLIMDMTDQLSTSEFRLKHALNSSKEGVWDWDIAENNLFLSPRFKEILGQDNKKFKGTFKEWERHLHPGDKRYVLSTLNHCTKTSNGEFDIECRIISKGKLVKWVRFRGAVASQSEEGNANRIIGTLVDITELHKKEERLNLASTVFETANEAVIVTNNQNQIIMANPSSTLITGYTKEEIIEKPITQYIGTESEEESLEDILSDLSANNRWQGEVICRRKSGELYVAWISASLVDDNQDAHGNKVILLSDISQRKATEERMRNLAHYDFLTGLPNRTLLSDRINQALLNARRRKGMLSIMFLDLDKFKPVNDQLGHHIGDLLLKELATRLKSCIRESDTAARLGGDEFVVLLSTIETAKNSLNIAEKIFEEIEKPFLLEKHTIHISVSIGIVIYPDDGTSAETLIANADKAMYKAKHAGGSKIVIFQLDD